MRPTLSRARLHPPLARLQQLLKQQKPPTVLRLLWLAKMLLRLLRLTPYLVRTRHRLHRLMLLAVRLQQLVRRLLPPQKHHRPQHPRPRLSKVRVMQELLHLRQIPANSRRSRVRLQLPLARPQQQLRHRKLLAVHRLLWQAKMLRRLLKLMH